MAVSSIKGCWHKFSARIRDYIDVVDSYYSPRIQNGDTDLSNNQTNHSLHHHHHHHHHHHQQHHIHRHNQLHHSLKQVEGPTHKRCQTCTRGGHSQHASTATTQPIDQASQNTTSNNNTSKKSRRNRHHQHVGGCLERGHLRLMCAFKNFAISADKLPPGYKRETTPQGQVYFVDATGHKYWHDPNVPQELIDAPLNLDQLVGPLSPTWEIRQTPSRKIYYVNHTKKTTQFTDPRLITHKDCLMAYLKQVQCQRPLPIPTTGNQTLSPTNANGGTNNRQSEELTTCPMSNNNSQNKQSSAQSSSQSSRNCTKTSPTHHQLSGSQNNHYSHKTSAPYNLTSLASLPKSASSKRHQFKADNLRNHMQLHEDNHYRLNLFSGSSQNLTSPTSSIHRNSSNVIPVRQALQDVTAYSGSVNNLSSISASNTSSSSQQQLASPQKSKSTANKELFDKMSILRQELLKQQVIAHPCRIEVNRKRIFEESCRVVNRMQPRDLKKRLLVKFRGEEGLDYGGVAREWFYLLSREILNPMHGLFQYTSDDIYNLQINPDSGIVYNEHLSYLKFCGRVIGMAVFHGHFIEGRFTLPFYKMLLRKPIGLRDIEFVDPELYRSLCWMLENDITNVIDTTFSVQHNAFGQLQEYELKEDGRNINVTEANKHEYVTLYVNYRCRRGIESQFDALQKGFYELISPKLVENFDEHELELLIGGLSKINIEDWRQNTKLKNCTVDTPLVKWFWDIVKSYSEDKRARLLQFVTGSPRVPIQGFKALQGVNSELRLFTIHLIRNACTDNLPKSHTCFNRIDLPSYETYEKLRDKLTQAIEETMGFAMQ